VIEFSHAAVGDPERDPAEQVSSSMSDYETCQQNIANLAVWYGANAGTRNEATTRLHLIDRLLFDCLGWNRDHVIAEERLENQYADYTFAFPRRLLIVEAKKEGTYFELPIGNDRIEYSIQSMFRTSAPLKSAMEQVAAYCQSRGVPYAVVTNGHQLVAFTASRDDGLPPSEGSCLVFPSLEFMSAGFVHLWNALSRGAVEKQMIRGRLLGTAVPKLAPKLANRIANYPGTKARNPFQASLQDVSELVLEDLVSTRELEPTFIRECYCQSGALSQHSHLNRSILRTRYAALFDSQHPGPALVPAIEKSGTSPDLLAESLARRPILLIGDVGVGKTTFIRHLLYVEAEHLKQTAIPLYLDLGRKGALTSELKPLILDDLERQLREQHGIDVQSDRLVRQVYSRDLNRFQHGIFGRLRTRKPKVYEEKELQFLDEFLRNREEHLRLSLEYLSRSMSRQIIIFLDNTDQRNDRDQEDAFLIAQEISERWPAIVFLPLRPETFHASRKRGALTGYHTRAFTVSPPRIDRVLQKRLAFGLKITRGDIPLSGLSSAITIRLEALQTLMECFLHSLGRSTELIPCIDNMAGGNVRLALDLLKGFFGSGHVDTEKIIQTYRYDDYVVPLHEFLRAVVYGDCEHYDPDRSLVANLFDIGSVDIREHFLMPAILGYLYAPGGDSTEEGFVPGRSVYEKFQAVGFTAEQVDFALVRAHNKKLIETAARVAPERGTAEFNVVRVTSVGAYHLLTLVGLFAYLDAVVVDTPILDTDSYHVITNCGEIRARLERAQVFGSYLDRAWKATPPVPGVFDWATASADLNQEITRIREGLDRKKFRYPPR